MDDVNEAPPRGATLSSVLTHQARIRPGQDFLRTPEEAIAYGEADRRVHAYAAGLQQNGIMPGDRMVLLMANSVEQVLLWLALNRVGAVNVPLNKALAGDLLARSLRLVRPAAVVADADVLPVLAAGMEAAECADRPVFIHDPDGKAAPDSDTGARRLTQLEGSTGVAPVRVDRLSPATMLFTSGSTGVAKGCVLSHHYLVRAGEIHAKYLEFRPDDVLYTPFPLFHIDAATLTVAAALVTGATAALSQRFSASRFWGEVRATRATIFNFMGATANILWKQPRGDRDRDHRVRLAWGVPMPACEPEWEERFGFPLVEVYGMTDAGLPAYQPLHESRRPGSCGRVIPEYEIRIADEAGNAVPTGAVGEILIRSDEPGLLMNEYFDMPEATRSAFRDGWFHTGDQGRLDADGHLYFVARSREVIRRRGENIAATDVEAAIDAHPDVRESAAVGVPSELSEDDIKVFVVPQPGAVLSGEDVVDHCRRLLPRHMLPRYVDVVEDLPKTPTEKIERLKLAAQPVVGPATWDAEPTPTPHVTSTRQEGTP
jgi:crotonobetaine/carnitine-CoA ligase